MSSSGDTKPCKCGHTKYSHAWWEGLCSVRGCSCESFETAVVERVMTDSPGRKPRAVRADSPGESVTQKVYDDLLNQIKALKGAR